MGTGHSAERADTKARLREQLRAARRERALPEITAAAAGLADAVGRWPIVGEASTVAAYVSVGAEPGTGLLLDALAASGTRVLLPVVLAGLDLDWAAYEGRDRLAPAVRGLLEPTGERLGRDAIAQAEVVLVPGLAVSSRGERLGQGGGCYDRALPRVRPGTPIAVVLYDDEVGVDVPTQPHDMPVAYAVTPSGVVSFEAGC